MKNITMIGALFVIFGYGRASGVSRTVSRRAEPRALSAYSVDETTSRSASSTRVSAGLHPCPRDLFRRRWGMPLNTGTPPGKPTCGATDSQNVS